MNWFIRLEFQFKTVYLLKIWRKIEPVKCLEF